MRVLHNARALARIAGWSAGFRHAKHAARLALAAKLDELSALLLLWRERLLRKK